MPVRRQPPIRHNALCWTRRESALRGHAFLRMLRKRALPGPAILIMAKTPSFRHGLPESSAMDGNLSVRKCLIKHDRQILVSRPCDWIPASRQE